MGKNGVIFAIEAMSKRAFNGITNVTHNRAAIFAFQIVPLEAMNMETEKAENMCLPLFLVDSGIVEIHG